MPGPIGVLLPIFGQKRLIIHAIKLHTKGMNYVHYPKDYIGPKDWLKGFPALGYILTCYPIGNTGFYHKSGRGLDCLVDQGNILPLGTGRVPWAFFWGNGLTASFWATFGDQFGPLTPVWTFF